MMAGVLFVLGLLAVTAGASASPSVTSLSTPAEPALGHSMPAISERAVAGAVAPTPVTIRPSTGVGTVVSTLDLATNRLLPGNTQPAAQGSPYEIVYDPANGDVYVRGADGESVTVVNATTDTAVTSLSMGYVTTAPGAPTIVPDGSTGDVYVSNPNLGTVSVVNASTNEVAATFTVPVGVTGMVLDPANGELYGADYGTREVAVFSARTGQIATNISVGSDPDMILFDPLSGKVFVSNYNAGNVSVISTATNTVVASPRTGTDSSEPVELVLDSVDDYVDVINSLTDNVTVLNGTTGAVVTSVTVGSVPNAAAFAPTQDELLVANGAGNTVSVLAQATNTVTHTLPIGHGAQMASYDPKNGYVYVATPESENVSVLNPATNTVVGSVTTNNYPDGVTAAPGTGDVFVLNQGSFRVETNLTVLGPTSDVPVASVPLVVYPYGITAAPNGALYVANWGGNDTYLLRASTNRVTGVGPAGYEPTSSAYDPSNGELYVIDTVYAEVTVLSASGTLVTTVAGPYDPQGIAFDAADGDFYVSNGLGTVTLIDGATNSVAQTLTVASGANLVGVLYDPHTLEVYVTDTTTSSVIVLNGTTQVASIPVGSRPLGLAYDSVNDTVFVANYNSDNLSVIGPTDKVVRTVSSYFPEFLAFDAGTDAIYMTTDENGNVNAFNASSYAGLGSPLDIQGSVRSEGIAYDPSSGEIYVSNEDWGSISILSTALPYPVTFVESGLPVGTPWSVTLAGVVNSSISSDVGFLELDGTYPYSLGPVAGYAANASSGSVVVSGTARTVDIGFSVPVFPVTFHETGLPAGTRWTVTLAGTPNASSSASIGFAEPNGSYAFGVSPVSGYSANTSSGSVSVRGGPRSVSVGFTASTASTYSVSFAETGLTVGTAWSVTLAGTLGQSSSSTVTFASEPNGSYPYSVGTVTGFRGAPSSGTLVVQGMPARVDITFSAASSNFSATLSASPASIVLGGSTTLTTTVTGGTPPFSYSYAPLPAGCTSRSVAVLSCTPTVAGTFTVNVSVTGSSGATAVGSTGLTVGAAVGPPASTASGGVPSSLVYIGGAIVVIVAVPVVLLLFLRRRRRSHGPPPAGPPV
jgi:YVTN family beta-propeller protein